MNSSVTVAFKYGIYTTIVLITYFLVIKLIGLHNNPWFRLANGLIMAYAIYAAIKYYKLTSGSTFNYTNGFKVGLLTGFLATIVFSLFMGIYMFHIDEAFKNDLLRGWFNDFDHGGGILIFIILVEGLASTIVLTLASMQLLKISRNLSQNE